MSQNLKFSQIHAFMEQWMQINDEKFTAHCYKEEKIQVS